MFDTQAADYETSGSKCRTRVTCDVGHATRLPQVLFGRIEWHP
jgi:hypothetical protein